MSTNPTSYTLREQAKAIVGGLLAGLTALGTALADGTVSPVEVVGIIIALLATYATVFGVSNSGAYAHGQRGIGNVIAVAAVTALATVLLLLLVLGRL